MSFYGITDYLAYLLGVIAIILLPGPNSMYCLFVAAAQGIKQGYKVVSAILLGDAILMLGAVMGAATLLKTSATVFMIFKLLGGAYLCYLGINLLIGAYKNLKKYENDNQEKATEDTLIKQSENKSSKQEDVFLKALTLSLSNPKAILFFLSFFLQFVDPTYPNPVLSFAILGTTLQMMSFAYLTTLIFMGTKLIAYFKDKKVLASSGNAGVGLLFIGFAGSLWTASV